MAICQRNAAEARARQKIADPKPSHDVEDRLHTAEVFISCKPDLFRPNFDHWIAENWAIYVGIEREAIRVWDAGRRHYSINTIVEWMRHHTLISDRDAEFKINDAWTSSLARLFCLMNADKATLFEFRERLSDGIVKVPT